MIMMRAGGDVGSCDNDDEDGGDVGSCDNDEAGGDVGSCDE